MGCTSSKLDDLPAVKLCRDRCMFLDEAIKQRYALAEAHLAYMQSLKSIGFSLHRFFDQDLVGNGDVVMKMPNSSPLLHLPHERKGGGGGALAGSDFPETSRGGNGNNKHDHHVHKKSNSGSGGEHLQFHDDDDSDDDDDEFSDGSLHHSGNSSPLHRFHNDHHIGYGGDHESLNTFHSSGGGGGGGMHMNYMRNQATPSVSYEQRPMSPDTVHMGQSSYYPPPYSNYDNSNGGSSYSNYGYSNYGEGGGGGGMNNYYGPPQSYGGGGNYGIPTRSHDEASSSKPPPPMPSPERTSTWDIFTPFEYDKYYSPYTPGRDLKQVREEEGIPDLEDEDYRQEVVKEVYVDPKFVGGNGKGVGGIYSKPMVHEEDRRISDNQNHYNTRPSVSVDDERMEYDVHVVDKKVVDSGKSEERNSNVAAFKGRGGSVGVVDVVKEIQAQFEKASECGNELASILEVGKLQYRRKHGASQVPSKMLHVLTPSLLVVSTPHSTSADVESSSSAPRLMGFEEETGIKLKNISSTLQKLYLWEKKLYHEVKAEEKMRVVHDRKRQRLKRLDLRGAEAHKVDTTRTLIRSLSTKIKIAIQVVDKISMTINTIRDEELWPLLNELVHGLARMWKFMLECHGSQCQAIKHARALDAIASHKKPGDAQFEATTQLERDLIGWTLRFSNWVIAQKGYIKALNDWLLKCLLYEPEETDDGLVPFSPGRMGAPPVFVICNQWAQAMERISEKEVLESMRLVANTVLQFWERDKLVLRENLISSKDTEKNVKLLDREEQKLQKEIHALEKKMITVSTLSEQSSVYQSDTSSTNSLQAALQHMFESMERYAASSLKAYEELLQRKEEHRVAGETSEVS